MSRAFCSTCKTYPETLLSLPLMGTDDEGAPIHPSQALMLNNHGMSLGMYADGTCGVNREEEDWAEEDDSPVCAMCRNEITWQHAPPSLEHIIKLLETMAYFWREGSAPLYKDATLMDDERTLREHVEQALADAREIVDGTPW